MSHAADVVEPMITYGTHPGMVVPIGGCVPDRPGDVVHAKSLAYMGLQPGERLRDKAPYTEAFAMPEEARAFCAAMARVSAGSAR